VAQRHPSFLARFWQTVDDNGIPPLWIGLYYGPLLAFSIFAAVTLPTIGAHPVVAGLPILAWVWAQTGATTAAMGGLWLRRSTAPVADMNMWGLRRDWLGLCLQATGHAVMCTMLAEFEVAVIKFMGSLPIPSLIWWLLAFGVAAISPYVIGTFFLTLQCVYKIDKGRKLQAEAP